MIKKILFPLLVMTFLSGCDAQSRERYINRPDYRMVPHHVVESPTAERAEMYFRMRKGNITVGSQALALMVSKHRYKSPVRAPRLEFQELDKKAFLSLTQELIPSIGVFGFGDAMNEWDVQLTPALPLDLTLEFGRGQGRLDLGGVDLERLRIYNQKGDLEIDLSGKQMTKDIIIWMNNHHGDIRLKIPVGAGAQITTVRGAEIEAPNFTKEKSIYTNERYKQSAYRIFVDVQSLDGKVIIQ